MEEGAWLAGAGTVDTVDVSDMTVELVASDDVASADDAGGV